MKDLKWEMPLEDETGLADALAAIRSSRGKWSKAWGVIYEHAQHQYSIQPVGIKLVPVVAEIAAETAPKMRSIHLAFVGMVACYAALRESKSVLEAAPTTLRRKYDAALKESAKLIAESLREKWNEADTRRLLMAYAAVRGIPEVADHLERFDSKYGIKCRSCGNWTA